MTRKILGIIFISMLGLSGCTTKTVKPSTCSSDADCDGVGGGVCYFGKCEECVKDGDCDEGDLCVNKSCAKTCQSDVNCEDGQYCSAGACHNKCNTDNPCAEGEACVTGKCVEGFAACTDDSGCNDGFTCDAGLCSKEGQYQMASGMVCDGSMRVNFAFNSYRLQKEYYDVADSVATCLKSNPNARLRVEGHTDDRGSTEYNLSLGENRAKAFVSYLANLGVDTNRVTIVSYGEEKPLNRDATEEAWAQNRRDEVIVEN